MNRNLSLLRVWCDDTKFLVFYTQLIEKRLHAPAIRGEKHHILPRCMGGSDADNIIKLTSREHFVAHALLARAFPRNEKLSYAFWAMCNQSNPHQDRTSPSSKIYERAKNARSSHISSLLKGRIFSAETREKMSASAKNRKRQSPACIPGHVKTAEAREKISQGAKNRMKRQCEHCNRVLVLWCYVRWHGKNCTFNKE